MSWEDILKKEFVTYDEIDQQWIDNNTLMMISGQPKKHITLYYDTTNITKPKTIASFVQRSGKSPYYTHLSMQIKLSDKNEFPISPKNITFQDFTYHYVIRVTEQKSTEDGLKTREKEFQFI